MASIIRDSNTGDLILRLEAMKIDPRSVVAQVEKAILDFLVKEFTDKHGENILKAIHESTISHQISDAIADSIQKQFFKGSQNEES